MNIIEEIDKKMDQLAAMMESNHHLNHPDEVKNHIESISKFWNMLNDDDRGYIQCARFALEERREWKV